MKSLILIVLLMAAQIGHAMDKHPTRAMLSLPSNNNNNLAFEDQDHQGLDTIMNQAKEYKCSHPDCINRPPFTSSLGLRMHELSHAATIEEQRPYPCRIKGCAMRFSQVAHRARHERSRFHTGEKTYACTFASCTKKFARQDDLNDHENVHRGLATICHLCNHVIPRARSIKTHMDTHNGTRPYQKSYQCECGKRFKNPISKGHKASCPKRAVLPSAQQAPQLDGDTIIGLADKPAQQPKLHPLSFAFMLHAANEDDDDHAHDPYDAE